MFNTGHQRYKMLLEEHFVSLVPCIEHLLSRCVDLFIWNFVQIFETSLYRCRLCKPWRYSAIHQHREGTTHRPQMVPEVPCPRTRLRRSVFYDYIQWCLENPEIVFLQFQVKSTRKCSTQGTSDTNAPRGAFCIAGTMYWMLIESLWWFIHMKFCPDFRDWIQWSKLPLVQ